MRPFIRISAAGRAANNRFLMKRLVPAHCRADQWIRTLRRIFQFERSPHALFSNTELSPLYLRVKRLHSSCEPLTSGTHYLAVCFS